jgi:hypothetical protein
MTRKQLNNLLIQVRRNWERAAKFTAIYETDSGYSTVAIENPLTLDTADLVLICDGEISHADFKDALT